MTLMCTGVNKRRGTPTVHSIKTPIAAIGRLFRHWDTEITSGVRQQLDQAQRAKLEAELRNTGLPVRKRAVPSYPVAQARELSWDVRPTLSDKI
jgi:hypothetical protein